MKLIQWLFCYLCAIRSFTSIALAVFFLFSSLGFHLDLEYCCGHLESLGIFDTEVVQLEKCCTSSDDSDCHDGDHIVKEMEHQDFQHTSVLKVPSLPVITIAHTVLPEVSTSEFSELLYHLPDQVEDPPRIRFQQFLC